MADAGPLRDIRIQLKTRMDKAVEDFRKAMAGTRTGRASVHMLDAVSVDYYGSQMPLNQIAQVHAPEPQLITVQPFDPSSLAAIEKGIRTADLGLESHERRQDHPRAGAAAYRRAPQGHGQASAQDAGRTPHRGAQYPTRRQRRHQEGHQGQEDRRGRREAARWTKSRS